MSVKYLGERFDIHTGGKEHKPVHHTNEIAQGYGAFRHHTANYWLHNDWLMIDGEKVSKSLGNSILVPDIMEKGFSPLALRYLVLTSHYRKGLNFTWSSLAAAQAAWEKLNEFVQSRRVEEYKGGSGRVTLSKEKAKKLDGYRQRFDEAINNDMQFPMALAVVWEMMKSNIPDYDKADTLRDWDQVLGLKLGQGEELVVPTEIKDMVENRNQLRREGKFVQADQVRVELEKLGWKIEDSIMGAKIVPKRPV
jgi:cysteinyl-tRNA synthetase